MHIPRFAPEFDDEAAARGRALYVLMRCWTCHGVDGTGGGEAAETLTDDDGNPIEAYDFSQGRFRSGGSPRDIFRTFTTGVNGTPMPSFNDALLVGRDAFTDLTRYREVVSAAEVREMERFVARLPTTDEIWGVSDEERETWSAQLRWDLVAYVLSLSGSGFTGYLGTGPYATD
jgi:mono/diheme cytochrome c family protein